MLLDTISDPIILDQKKFLKAQEAKAIDDFVSSGTLPKKVDDFFANSITLYGESAIFGNAVVHGGKRHSHCPAQASFGAGSKFDGGDPRLCEPIAVVQRIAKPIEQTQCGGTDIATSADTKANGISEQAVVYATKEHTRHGGAGVWK